MPRESIMTRPTSRGLRSTLLAALMMATAVSPLHAGAIHDAAKRGDVGAIKKLLKKDRQALDSIDDDGRTALHIAAEDGRKDVADLLLKSGASSTIRSMHGETALDLAVTAGGPEMAGGLLRRGAD